MNFIPSRLTGKIDELSVYTGSYRFSKKSSTQKTQEEQEE
jgi:hypothetical protein